MLKSATVFFALGMAQQLKQPVALVCTSGSAVLNYYPAIAEAFYSDIPLIVISADRPIERIDIGDGQTIRQKNVFANHILYSANLHSALVLEDENIDANWTEIIQNFNKIWSKAGSEAGKEPTPIRLEVTGAPVSSWKSRSRSAALARLIRTISRAGAEESRM